MQYGIVQGDCPSHQAPRRKIIARVPVSNNIAQLAGLVQEVHRLKTWGGGKDVGGSRKPVITIKLTSTQCIINLLSE